LDPGNIDPLITNINMTPALRCKRGMPWLGTGEPEIPDYALHSHQRNLGGGEMPSIRAGKEQIP
jgi:hypothetical protein